MEYFLWLFFIQIKLFIIIIKGGNSFWNWNKTVTRNWFCGLTFVRLFYSFLIYLSISYQVGTVFKMTSFFKSKWSYLTSIFQEGTAFKLKSQYSGERERKFIFFKIILLHIENSFDLINIARNIHKNTVRRTKNYTPLSNEKPPKKRKENKLHKRRNIEKRNSLSI